MTTATQTTVKLFIRGKPISWNHAYGRRGTRTFLTPAARVWKENVTWHVYATGARGRFKQPAISYRFTGVRADADNLIKLTADAIAAALDLDDRHFRIASASVERDGEPGVWLEIQEVEGGV